MFDAKGTTQDSTGLERGLSSGQKTLLWLKGLQQDSKELTGAQNCSTALNYIYWRLLGLKMAHLFGLWIKRTNWGSKEFTVNEKNLLTLTGTQKGTPLNRAHRA